MKFKYIIRKRALGDVIWIEPVIRTLAEKNIKLIVHTKYNELFENYPYPNVYFKNRLNVFEKILIWIEKLLHTSFFVLNLDDVYEQHPKMHMLNAYQQQAGLAQVDDYPKLYLSQQEKEAQPFPGRYIVLHLESTSDKNYRTVYGIDWNLIAQFFKEQDITIVQIGVNPKPVENAIQKKTTLRELISLVYHSKLFIGLDSGPSHIATSLGIPSLLFFGAVNPAYRHFFKLFNGIIMQGKCEFNGCYHNEVMNTKGPTCRLVGDEGIPKCSVHTTVDVIANIQKLIPQDHVVLH